MDVSTFNTADDLYLQECKPLYMRQNVLFISFFKYFIYNLSNAVLV